MPLHSPLWEVAEPYLVGAGLYTVKDPTYGRWGLPHHPPHRLLLDDEEVSHTFRRIFLPPYSSFASYHEAYESTEIIFSEDVSLTPEEIKLGVDRGGRWIFYSVWEMKQEPKTGWEGGGRGRGHDVVLVHGLSDYGLRYAPHVKHFLKAGFRMIIPDLPSYGFSTGVNSYLPSVMLLPAALHAVLTDVVQRDVNDQISQRKVFLCGASMGAWTVLYYLLKYPPSSSSIEIAKQATEPDSPPPPKGQGKGYHDGEGAREEEKPRVQAAGAFVLCPAVEVAKASRPHYAIELLARGLRYFAGSLPLAPAVRGNVSDDPKVEADFFADPIGYHGWLRVGTGLSLLEGMTELEARGAEIDVPIRLIHGTHDRVTNHRATLRLFERLKNADKEVELYDGYEHVMLRVGSDAEDDEQRQRVLRDWRSWLLERCS